MFIVCICIFSCMYFIYICFIRMKFDERDCGFDFYKIVLILYLFVIIGIC